MRDVLKAWVILKKKCNPLVYVPSCGYLSQEHCFAKVKIKITIEFENWLRCCDELQTLGKPSYYIILYYNHHRRSNHEGQGTFEKHVPKDEV